MAAAGEAPLRVRRGGEGEEAGAVPGGRAGQGHVRLPPRPAPLQGLATLHWGLPCGAGGNGVVPVSRPGGSYTLMKRGEEGASPRGSPLAVVRKRLPRKATGRPSVKGHPDRAGGLYRAGRGPAQWGPGWSVRSIEALA